MPTTVIVLVMKNGKKVSYQVNPDGSTSYNKDRKVTKSFIRAVNIARLESKKTDTCIKFVEIEMPDELKKIEAEKAAAKAAESSETPKMK